MAGRSTYIITPTENVSVNVRAHTRLCRDRYGRISSDSSEIADPPLTQKGSRSSAEAAAGYPAEDRRIGIGTVITYTTGRTQTDIPLGRDLEVVVVEAITLEGVDRMIIKAESGVSEGYLVTTTTPPLDTHTRTYSNSGTEVRTFGTEVGWCKCLLIWGMGNL